MENLKLVKADKSYGDEVIAYRREMLEAESSMDGCGPLKRCETAEEYFNIIETYQHKETLPPKMVIATQFFCVREDDNKVVGMIQVRHYFNEYLEKYAGHIGYSVRPDERRKGVASWMLKNVLPFCKSIGLEKVLVCCLVENEASRKTILKNGGVYDGTVLCERDGGVHLERYWVDTNQD